MFSKTSQRPLYLQLVDTLELKIRNSLSPHDKLDSERELTEAYQVSRITVRQALSELEKRGLVYKKRGKGTFVSEIGEPALDLANSYSFTDQMKRLGRTPKTQLLSFECLSASDTIAQQLGIEEGDAIYEIERLRLADTIPMMLERSYLPSHLFQGISRDMLLEKPLYNLVEENFGHRIRLAEEDFYASIALQNEATLLDVKKGSPVLHLIRKTFNSENHVIELTLSVARADQFHYKITHTRPL